MQKTRKSGRLLGIAAAVSGLAWGLGVSAASAGPTYFPLGFGSAGKPDSFALENYTFFQQVGTNTQVIGDVGELAYFSKTGFTGTARDQFEFYGFFSGGYVSTPVQGGHGAGIGHPELGIEYYYQVIQPTVTNADAPDYFTFWTSPNIQVNFPNGYSGASGYGAGSNQYQFTGNLQNYIRQGKFAITFVPIVGTYGFANQNTTIANIGGVATPVRARGGFSFSTAVFTAGYHITDDFWIGATHSLNFNNVSDSFPAVRESREGTIGPNVEYDGFGPKFNTYVQVAVTTDYYRTGGLKQNTSFFLYLFKYISPDEPAKTVTAKY